jgi:TolB protein
MIRLHHIWIFVFLLSSKVYALDLELTQGINSALPIAINSWGMSREGQEIQSVLENDLALSGQFRLIRPNSDFPNTINSLKLAGADSVVIGHVENTGGGRYTVSFDLIDAVSKGKRLLSKTYDIPGKQVRALAHHISDEIYEKLIGEKGIFSTRIAYILVQRGSNQTRYSLEVGNIDGHDVQSLLVSSEPILSPAWSPDGKQLAYVSFEKRRSQIYTVSVETGQRRLITSFPGINSAPSWSPDGRHLALVLSKSGSPKVYTVDLSSGQLKQLTFGDSIDTEPKYAPDGRSILFTSGRGGSPQVYKLHVGDGQISRVTFNGNYNAKATYTPDQKNMVMLHREDNQFNIGVQPAQGGNVHTLTFAALDESPTVSPNSRLVLYATRYQDKGILGIVSIDGRIRMRLPSQKGDVQEPAWSPYLGG